MALQIRRGTESDRVTQIANFKAGELIYTTDNKELWVGAGGSIMTKINMVKSVNTQTGDVVLTTDQITQGTSNKYYSSTLAKTDAGAALVNGNGGNTGITFSYNSGTNTINAVVTQLGGLTTVSSDTSPSLGGNLSLNTRNITGTGNINISGSVTATSHVGPVTTDAITPATSLIVYGASEIPLSVRGLVNPNAVCLDINSFKGTAISPTNILANDQVGSFRISGYYNGSYKLSSSLTTVLAADADIATNFPHSIMYFALGNNSASLSPSATLDGAGVFKAPVFQLTSYANDAARTAAIPTPVAGMMVFMASGTSPSVTNKAVIYNGSAWALLPG